MNQGVTGSKPVRSTIDIWFVGTQRYAPQVEDDEEKLVARIIELATQFGRYGYRRITAMLRQEGWQVNHKKIERIWRKEGLKVPKKQPKRRRLWLNDGSCIRLRPEHKDHVWSYDFVMARTSEGRSFRMLNIIDEYTRECLAILVVNLTNIFRNSIFIVYTTKGGLI